MFLLAAATAFAMCDFGTPNQAEAREPTAAETFILPEGHIYRYDLEDDKLFVGRGVWNRPPGWRRGTDASYHGTRLRAFQYFGPANQGGVYDAIRSYQKQHNLDPKKYQYRWNRTS